MQIFSGHVSSCICTHCNRIRQECADYICSLSQRNDRGSFSRARVSRPHLCRFSVLRGQCSDRVCKKRNMRAQTSVRIHQLCSHRIPHPTGLYRAASPPLSVSRVARLQLYRSCRFIRYITDFTVTRRRRVVRLERSRRPARLAYVTYRAYTRRDLA